MLATKAHLDAECAFYEKETPPSQKEIKRTSILLTTLAQEYKVCDKINVHHPRNYYLWYYRQKLTLEVLKPLIQTNLLVTEELLAQEIKAMSQYVRHKPEDASAKWYLEQIKQN